MLHPHTELCQVDETVGLGVVATRRIPMGTITWTSDPLDQVLSTAELQVLPAALRAVVQRYSYRNSAGNYVISWDHARFVNHSCAPNVLSPGWDIEIAIRDIEPGEELTDDYGALNGDDVLDCACGTTQCRGLIRGSDIYQLAPVWDALISVAMSRVGHVAQPLWPVLDSQVAVEIDEVLRGFRRIPSCLRLAYRGEMAS